MQKYWSQMPRKRLYCGVAAVVLGVAAAGGILWNLKSQPQIVEEELPTARTLVVGAKKRLKATRMPEKCGGVTKVSWPFK